MSIMQAKTMEHRLQFLLKQAEVFQHFAGGALKKCVLQFLRRKRCCHACSC